jgi:tetratricopeptide (TPR) repeat protein
MAGRVDQERIFLSAVSDEFRTAREALARALHGTGLDVREQDTLRIEPGSLTLLDKLHDYIKVSTVVALMGTRSGGKPPASDAMRYRDLLPDEFGKESYGDWSYTQWEVIFTLHYNRPFIPILAADSFPRDRAGAADETQARLKAWLRSINVDLTRTVEDAKDFRIEALRSLLKAGMPVPQSQVEHDPKPIHPDIHSIGELFTGRDDFLVRLRASLSRAGGTVSAIRALNGLGGIGKTRTAMEYALRHQDDYTALLFVRAYDEATLDRELAALTGVLRLPERDATDDNVRKDAVLRWLMAHPGWLLILDNVDTPEALRAATALARSLRSGHVLLTSRLEGSFAQDIETLELGLLTPEDAVAYLLKATEGRRRPEVDAEAQAGVLTEALDHLTLALVHAGAYIAERRITFARYLEEWRNNRARVLDWAAPDVTGYPMSLAQTWITSFDQLTPAGRALLERLSFFANDPIPEFLLDVPLPTPAERALAEGLSVFATNPAPQFRPAPPRFDAETADGIVPLLDLQRFSLINRDAKAESFTIHRIVRDVTNRRLTSDPDAHKARLTEALNWVNAAFVDDPADSKTWFRFDPLAPHAETLAFVAESAKIASPTSRLMSELGLLFDTKAAYAHAELLYRGALSIDEASFGLDHQIVAQDLNGLASVLKAIDRFDEAEVLLRRAVAIAERCFGSHHPRMAYYLDRLAGLLRETNRLAEAEPLVRRALDICEATLGMDHESVAGPLHELGRLLYETNRLTDAEPLMRRSLAINEASFGPNDSNVASGLISLASLLADTNRMVEAEPLIRRALAIYVACFGPNHPHIAVCLNNLVKWLLANGRSVEAEPLMRRALAISEASFGPEHSDVLSSLNNLAQVLSSRGRLAEAEPLMRRILRIDEARLDPDHPDIARDLNNLAQLLQRTNRHSEAEPLMRRNLVILLKFQRRSGHAHPFRDHAIRNYRHLLSALRWRKTSIRAAITTAHREAGLPVPNS